MFHNSCVGISPAISRVVFAAILFTVAIQAQNVDVQRYPAYQVELEQFKAAFDQKKAGDQGEAIAREGIVKARSRQDRDGEAHWLRMLGASFEQRGDFQKARPFYEQSLAIRRELDQKPDVLLLTRGIGMVRFRSRDYSGALNYLAAAVKLASELKDSSSEAWAFSLAGQVEQAQGHMRQAAEAYQQARDVYAVSGPKGRSDLALTHLRLARLNTAMSDFPSALRDGFQAVRLYSALPKRDADVATALDAVGIVFHHLEQPHKALDYYQQALAIREKSAPGMSAESYTLIGAELDKTGSHAEAIEDFLKVLDARRQAKDPGLIAGALINLAVAQQGAGSLAEARKNFTEAIGLVKQDSTFRSQSATALYGLGNVDIAENKVDDALAHHRAAYQIRTELGESLGCLRSLNRIAIALEDGRRWNEALEAHRQALAQFETLSSPIADPVQAAEFRRTSEVLYPHYARVLMELGRNEEALLMAERGRGVGFARIASMHAHGSSELLKPAEREALAVATTKLAQTRNRLRILLETRDAAGQDEAEVAYVEADRELTRVRDGLFASNSRPQAGQGQSPRASYADLLGYAKKHPDTVFLEWLGVDNVTFLFALSGSGGLSVFPLPASLTDVAQSLDKWYGTLRSGQMARGFKHDGPIGGNETALARNIYNAIFGPARKLLDRSKCNRLVVVADGPLLQTPFAALIDDRGERLLDRYSLSATVSLTSLLQAPPSTPSRMQVYAVADPIGAGETRMIVPQSMRFESLAGAREEALAVAALLPGSATAIGRDARESVVKKEMQRYGILHFATHGIVDSDDPLRSCLLLAAEPASSGEDGQLEAWEIALLPLSSRLAVLSACQTGQGRETLGDGLLGLSWAFQAAGCPNVVASLWSVDDVATRVLMIAFYKELRAGKRVDDALRSAMLETRANPKYQSPYYWAAFAVTGPASSLF